MRLKIEENKSTTLITFHTFFLDTTERKKQTFTEIYTTEECMSAKSEATGKNI